MKRGLILLAGFFLLFTMLSAQIQTRDLPLPGYQERIRNYVNDLQIVDTHEHLQAPEDIVKRSNLDFTLLFHHYASDDLKSAGMSSAVYSLVTGDKLSVKERWEIFKPFWEASRNTGYNRVPLIVAEGLYGLSTINDDNIEELSKKINEAYKNTNWYNYVLRDKSRIKYTILDVGHRKFVDEKYVYVKRFEHFVNVFSKGEIQKTGEAFKIDIKTLDDYLIVLRKEFIKAVESGIVAVKSALAYNRIIHYENVSDEQAETVFNMLFTNKDQKTSFTFKEVKPLQDYMMHHIVQLAEEFDLPVQIHTGLQAGNGNIITNSKPTHLINLFREYPDVNFCIFHSSYPYGGELSTLAKNFPNVFIDMCWTHIISPYYSERYLHEWLETVPANKIMAFGGDYLNVENIYGHAEMARKVVTKVLIEKVSNGYITEVEAINIAGKILRDNALEIFKLDGKSRRGENLPEISTPGFAHDLWEMVKTNSGFVRNWMIIGPFAIGAAQLSPDIAPPGFDKDYPPENEIDFEKTYEGLNATVNWKRIKTGKSGILDFNRHIQKDRESIVYAYSEIISPDNRKIKLTLGSDDGAKMWINGKLIYNEHIWRGVEVDDIIIDAELIKGVNKLLVKVENRGMNWGLVVRIIDPRHELIFSEMKK